MSTREAKWQLAELAIAEVAIVPELTVREPRRATVLEYAQAMRAGGDAFPPIEVARIGQALYLVDGRHRLEATASVGRLTIQAQVARMTWERASAYAATANIGHGRPLGSQAAKSRALEMFLKDRANAGLSHREVSKRLGGIVSHVTVMNYRNRMGAGGLKGAKAREPGAAEAAAAEAGQARVVETAQRHLVGLEGLYARMEDPTDRHFFLEALRAAMGRMETAGNVEVPDGLDI